MVKELNIGYDIPNLTDIANKVIEVFGIKSDVGIVPLKLKQIDENAYVVNSENDFIIFVSTDILLKDKIDMFNIKLMIHELTHVHQMERGDLSFSEDRKIAYWKGEEYTNKTHYEQRPWEIEARNNERKYLKEIKLLLN